MFKSNAVGSGQVRTNAPGVLHIFIDIPEEEIAIGVDVLLLKGASNTFEQVGEVVSARGILCAVDVRDLSGLKVLCDAAGGAVSGEGIVILGRGNAVEVSSYLHGVRTPNLCQVVADSVVPGLAE